MNILGLINKKPERGLNLEKTDPERRTVASCRQEAAFLRGERLNAAAFGSGLDVSMETSAVGPGGARFTCGSPPVGTGRG